MSDPFPPPNPFLGWYRLILWLMPTCIALATVLLFDRFVPGTASLSPAWFFGWLGVNAACAVGFGLLDRKLSNPTASSNSPIQHLAGFLFLQLLIVPVALIAIVLVNFHAD